MTARLAPRRCVILLASLGSVATLAVGCGSGIIHANYLATDGRHFEAMFQNYMPTRNGSEMDAVRASAAHDLQCPAEQLTVQHLPHDQEAVDGCGQRAMYQLVCTWQVDTDWCKLVMTGRFHP